jgi:hypothetical protein
MSYENLIEEYEALRSKCYKAIKNGDKALLGGDYWLRAAIQEEDIQMVASYNGIECYGSAYTTQSMSNEHFDCVIPYSELEKND